MTEVFGLPLAKRQKVTAEEESRPSAPEGSRIFSPFRTLGLVSPTEVPFTSIPLGKTTFQITTSVGQSLQTYDLRRGLNLVFLTRPQSPAPITATCAWKDRVFAAWGGQSPNQQRGVWVFKRGKKVAELDISSASAASPTEPIERLVVFGSWIVGCCGSSILVWKSADYSHYTTLSPPAVQTSTILLTSTLCTMPTYLNKIFVGRADGCVDIWNVSTGKLVYSILPTCPNAGAVSALQPAPALSLLAIAYTSGALTIHNIQTDRPVLHLRKPGPSTAPITTISFRTDGIGAGQDGRKDGVMATAGADSGDIVMWDLNDGGRVTGILRHAHEPSGEGKTARINKIEFLAGQPVMVSTGSDNSLRTWIFDETPFSPTPRPLHARSGHSAPITKVMFVPSGSDGSETIGKWLLSGGQDRSLFGLSLRKDSQNAELSQGKVKSKAKKTGALTAQSGQQMMRYEELKAPEITTIACSLNRDGGMGAAVGGPIWANAKAASAENTNITGWESIVTGHKGDKYARTWIWGKKKAGRWALETGDGTEVKSVAISQCGTFSLVGSEGGSLVMYNLQSGILRQTFPPKANPTQVKKAKMRELVLQDDSELLETKKSAKHTKAVTGIAIDNLNTKVISCGLDGKVKFWSLLTGQLLHELDWNPMCAITGLRFSSTSDLIALSCDDLSIRVIDTQTKKLVRELWGCVGQINDFTISNDGQWIVAASMDSIVRVWDLPTGHLIDAFKLKNTCVSLTFSSTGEFLATAHADGVGINIWNNKSLFMHVPTKHIDEDTVALVAAPTASGEGGVAIVEAAFDGNEAQDNQEEPLLTPEQLSQTMMTLSMTPKTRWQTLLHLDTIKQRNKPKEAPKKPKKAPFFLPSIEPNPLYESESPNKAAVEEDRDPAISQAERSRIARINRVNGSHGQSSQFTTLLRNSGRYAEFTPFIEYLKLLSPAKTDLEIRSLDPRSRDDRENELALFVHALTERLKQKRDFELVNTWMAVFLRVHDDAVEAAVGPEASDDQADIFGANAALQRALGEWKEVQENEAKRLADLVSYCRGVIGFLRSAR